MPQLCHSVRIDCLSHGARCLHHSSTTTSGYEINRNRLGPGDGVTVHDDINFDVVNNENFTRRSLAARHKRFNDESHFLRPSDDAIQKLSSFGDDSICRVDNQ